MHKGATYSDNYFNYLFILMRYASFVTRRRIKNRILLFLEYSPTGDIKDGDIRFVIINDKNKNRLLMFVYTKTEVDDVFKYLGEVRIFGYYPKQVRKILYNVQKKIREEDEYRNKIAKKPVTISKARSSAYKKWMGNR
jgi:hypothetical protein